MSIIKKISRTIWEARKAQHIRSRSGRLRNLRKRLAAQLEDSCCLIIGSAPDIIIPESILNMPKLQIICVNGSPCIAKNFGITSTDITIIVGHTTALKSEKSRATIPLLNGLHTGEVIFIENLDNKQHAMSVLDTARFQYDRFTSLSTHERSAIIGEVCGVELGIGKRHDRISAGAFAAVISAWANAGEIIMCGFSLKGGHKYIEKELPRDHVGGDQSFFRLAMQLQLPIKTTSVEIHETCRIPLYTNQFGRKLL
jgi:hypothetical protein